jgi:hypothetical protein
MQGRSGALGSTVGAHQSPDASPYFTAPETAKATGRRRCGSPQRGACLLRVALLQRRYGFDKRLMPVTDGLNLRPRPCGVS